MERVEQALQKAVKELFKVDMAVEITRPEQKFGDFSCNVALKLAKQLDQEPRQTAQKLADYLNSSQISGWLQKADVAGPGFVNMWLKDDVFNEVLDDAVKQGQNYGHSQKYAGQNILVEYLDPNPFKEIHIGHAYSGTVGDAIARLFEAAGGKVRRVTYQGDVGLHVAKAIYGILQRINNDSSKLEIIAVIDRPRFLGEAYAAGAKMFEEDETAKAEIQSLNKKIYDRSDQKVNKIHELGRAWSLEYFDKVYKQFDFTPFEKNYLEGTVAAEGLKLVNEHIADGVFEKSQGAIIFDGEKYGLHTRVFVTSQGLPTYEAKDLGNAMLKMQDYKYDKSIIITAEEQADYFKVMLKALEQFAPEQAKATTHIPHGMVKLSTGKMSSRSGQVIRALDLLKNAEEAAQRMATDKTTPAHDVALAAIKYAFLKNRIGGDIVYDVEESLSLEGNSGPYLQYAHARAQSILKKATKTTTAVNITEFDEFEKHLSLKISEYPEVVQKATDELMPHHICTYLYELAQVFNRFYENDKVIGSPQEPWRIKLVTVYADVLKNGLSLLKIPAPEHM